MSYTFLKRNVFNLDLKRLTSGLTSEQARISNFNTGKDQKDNAWVVGLAFENILRAKRPQRRRARRSGCFRRLNQTVKKLILLFAVGGLLLVTQNLAPLTKRRRHVVCKRKSYAGPHNRRSLKNIILIRPLSKIIWLATTLIWKSDKKSSF